MIDSSKYHALCNVPIPVRQLILSRVLVLGIPFPQGNRLSSVSTNTLENVSTDTPMNPSPIMTSKFLILSS